MERIIYDRMAEHDTRHWWYRARRDILSALIKRKIQPVGDARILEIGCGTGHNLPMLAAFGTVDAIEIDPAARAIASARLGQQVGEAPLPGLDGVRRGAYDLIALLDVLEHIEDDHAALVNIAECLRSGGKLLITVPAHQWMWSAHDVANHHFRRYSKARLRAVLQNAGLRIGLLSSFNSLLFPLAVASRLFGKLTGKEGSDDALPPGPVNAAFEKIFVLEAQLVGRVPMPPGVSIVAIVSVA
jgi:SAM-dependent methyltransferase